MTSLSACAHEIIASLNWAGGRRLATRCMVSGTVSAWIVVAVAWPEIAAWMVAIICSGLRHSPMMMSVGWRRIAGIVMEPRFNVPRHEVLKALHVAGNLALRDGAGHALDAIEQEFDRLGAFDDVAMGVRVAELLDRHRADQSRLARSGRARDDHHALCHPIMGEDFRFDILLVERLRQIPHWA